MIDMKKIIIVFLIAISSLISGVYADDKNVNFAELPNQLAERLNISLFAAQILISSIILGIGLFPTLILTRGRNPLAALLIGMCLLSFCIALGWFPVWIFVLICFLIAVLFAKQITKVLGG